MFGSSTLLHFALLTSIGATLLVACSSGEEPYDTIPRDKNQVAVADLITEGRWFYVPTTGAAPRFARNQFPFLQGVGKYAELCFNERGLEVRSFDRNNPKATLPKTSEGFCLTEDAENTDALVNFPQILTIPGTYATYRCREDNYGDCTNTEEVNTDDDLPFKQNTHFTPNPAQLIVSELNLDDIFGLQSGVIEQGSPELLHWEFDPAMGVLNFELERTFKVDISRISNYIGWSNKADFADGSSDGAFKSRFYYSIIHEKNLVDPTYIPITIAQGQSEQFGFFANAYKQLNPLTNFYDSEIKYLNRFSPAKKTIDYHLSDSFFKSRNAAFRTSVIETVDSLNATLDNSPKTDEIPRLRIVNPDGPTAVHAGDLRFNVVNLIDERIDRGLLGYGPSFANPTTGEIVKGQINLYPEIARTTVSRYWDSIATVYNRGELTGPNGEPINTIPPPPTSATNAGENTDNSLTKLPSASNSISRLENQSLRIASSHNIQRNLANVTSAIDDIDPPSSPLRSISPTIDIAEINDDMDLEQVARLQRERLSHWSRNNVYPVEAAMWVSSTNKFPLSNLQLDDDYFQIITNEIDGSESGRNLRLWNQLPQHLQAIVSDAITTYIVRNTFVHEMGHNLGLRHNFQGSNDRANFFTAERAAALGLSRIPAYSSVMDYAASILDDAPTWGEYDLAALRFGYGRLFEARGATADANFGQATASAGSLIQCETDNPNAQPADDPVYWCDLTDYDGAVASLPQQLNNETQYGPRAYLAGRIGEQLERRYLYCTDSNETLNSNCNAFDEGTDLEEIVEFEWQRYLDTYMHMTAAEYRSNGYFLEDYPRYLLFRFNEFEQIRNKLEESERIDELLRTRGLNDATQLPGDLIAELTLQACDDNPIFTPPWYCEYGRSALTAAAFFLDILATPEHQCIVSNGVDTQSVSLGEALNTSLVNVPPEYKPARASCFDATATDALQFVYGSEIEVLAETRDGRFLSSIGSNDPHFPWNNAVSVLGNWGDKVLASYFLSKRTSLQSGEENHYTSLLDWPGVKRQYDNIMNNILASEPLGLEIALVDSDGLTYVPPPTLQINLHVTEQLESLPEMPRGIEEFFSIPSTGRTSIAKMLLQVGADHVRTEDFHLSDRSLRQYQSLVKQQNRYDIIAGDTLEFQLDGELYVATPANALAWRYASQIQLDSNFQYLNLLEQFTTEELLEISAEINAAWGSAIQWAPLFKFPIRLVDPTLVQHMIDFIASDYDQDFVISNPWAAIVNPAWERYIAENSDSILLDEEAQTFQYENGQIHQPADVFISFFAIYQLTFIGAIPELQHAVTSVHAGWLAAPEAERPIWQRDMLLLDAYLAGNYQFVAGDLYKILEQIPTAE